MLCLLFLFSRCCCQEGSHWAYKIHLVAVLQTCIDVEMLQFPTCPTQIGIKQPHQGNTLDTSFFSYPILSPRYCVLLFHIDRIIDQRLCVRDISQFDRLLSVQHVPIVSKFFSHFSFSYWFLFSQQYIRSTRVIPLFQYPSLCSRFRCFFLSLQKFRPVAGENV